MSAARTLALIRLAHTLVWAFFVACILGVPMAAHAGRFGLAALFALLVLGEVVVLALNRWRCPLTAVAARHAEPAAIADPAFDIYLPRWIAAHNKTLFGTLYVAGLVYAGLRWLAVGSG